MKKIVNLGFILTSFLMLVWADSSKVDMNRADIVQLSSLLDGVGMQKARAIVEWRNQYGAFRSVADVAKVKGMARLAEKNRERMLFGVMLESSSVSSEIRVDEHTLLIPFRP